MKPGNLFESLPVSDQEVFEALLHGDGLRIERIVSRGQTSPPGFWYDQEDNEWVVLLSGRAGLRTEDRAEVLELAPGDYLLIPAHCRHRVEWTAPEEETVWLAVHFRGRCLIPGVDAQVDGGSIS